MQYKIGDTKTMSSFEEMRYDVTPRVASNDDDDDDDAPAEEEEEEDEEEEDDATVPRTYGNNATDKHLQINAVPNLDHLSALRDLSSDVVCWQLSSAKPGNGIEQILDASPETYWQSDGQAQPHWIQVHFSRRVAISHVCLYLDFSLDESYTPKKLSVQAGMTHQDLWEAIPVVELSEPAGWCILPLQSSPDPLDDLGDEDDEDEQVENQDMGAYSNSNINKTKKNVVRAHLIRISIQSMHQNGRDTHVRKLRLFGPRMNHRWPSETMPASPDGILQSKNHKVERTQTLGLGNWFPSIR